MANDDDKSGIDVEGLRKDLESERKASSSKDKKIGELQARLKEVEGKLPDIESERGEVEERLTDLEERETALQIREHVLGRCLEEGLPIDKGLAMLPGDQETIDRRLDVLREVANDAYDGKLNDTVNVRKIDHRLQPYGPERPVRAHPELDKDQARGLKILKMGRKGLDKLPERVREKLLEGLK